MWMVRAAMAERAATVLGRRWQGVRPPCSRAVSSGERERVAPEPSPAAVEVTLVRGDPTYPLKRPDHRSGARRIRGQRSRDGPQAPSFRICAVTSSAGTSAAEPVPVAV